MAVYEKRPYVRPAYESQLRLGDMLRMRGRNLAEAEYARGDASARMWQNLGNTVANTVQHVTEARAQEKEQKKAEDKEAQLSRQDAAFVGLLQKVPNPDPRDVIAIYGPQRGMAIAQGLSAFTELQTGAVKDARETAGRLAIGMKAASPTLQAQFWPSIRDAAIKGGLGTPEDIPEQPTSEYLDAIIGWATGKEPTAPAKVGTREIKVRNEDGSESIQIVADTPGQSFTSAAAPEKPTNPTEASLAAAAAAGDQTAAKALQLLRHQSASGTATERPSQWVQKDGESRYVTPSEAAALSRQGWKSGSTREQGRPVTSGDAGRFAELQTSLDDLKVLRATLFPDADLNAGDLETEKPTGTRAAIGAAMPNWVTELTGWGEDAKSRQAVIDRVKQVIGKALEGGVLRKEDEVKYEKILPTIKDIPSVVKDKLDGLDRAIALRLQREMDAREDAGYDVSQFRQRGAIGAAADPNTAVVVKAPDGKFYTFPNAAAADGFKRAAGIR